MFCEGDAVETLLYGLHDQFLGLGISITAELGVNMEINSGFHFVMVTGKQPFLHALIDLGNA
jgi:hypothetical protein